MMKKPRWIWVLTLVICYGLLADYSGALARGPSKDKANDTKDLFNEEMRSLRPENMLLSMSYLEVNGVAYGYYLPRRLVQMAQTGDTFHLRKFKTKDNMLILEMETNRKARLKIHVFDPEKKVSATLMDDVFPLVLADIFDFGTPLEFPRVVVNSRSGLAHLGACNHLPKESLRIAFDDDLSAKAAGYRLCPACFPPDPPLPYFNYMPIRTAALEETRHFERAFPPIPDQALQDSIQSLGEALVAHLPFEDKGFSYRFRVVESEIMQGHSFPTGFVYITDRLLAAVEDEVELAHVLAHEVAHCELHLAPNPQIRKPDFVLGETWGRYFKDVRWRETEADLVAISTLSRLYPDRDGAAAAINILSKLQFANEAIPLMEGNSYDSHPPYGSRLEWLKNGYFPVKSPYYFEAREDGGDWVSRVRVLGGGRDDKKASVVHLLVQMSPGARSEKEAVSSHVLDEFGAASGGRGPSRIIFSNGKRFDLDAKAHGKISPGFMRIVTYKIKGMKEKDFGVSTTKHPKTFDPSDLKGIIVSVPGNLKWFVVPVTVE